MTGMKEGAGEDPFAEDPAESDDEDSEVASPTMTDMGSGRDRSTRSATQTSTREYPYFLTRSTVKEDRTNEAVFFLRDEYAAYEDEVHDAVEDLLDDDVYLTDLREAIVATADPEEIAAQLKDWGQDVS